MMNSALPAAVKQQVSRGIADLLVSLLEHAQQQELPVTPFWLKSGCNLLLRALTRTDPFSNNPQLPLLPEDALKVLTWIDGNLAAKDASNQENSNGKWYAADTNGSAANGAAGGVGHGTGGDSPGVIEPALAADAATARKAAHSNLLERDDKLYLLASKLAVTAFAENHSVGSSSSSSSNVLSPGSGSSSRVKQAKELAMLARLLSWSSNLVKGALERLISLQGALPVLLMARIIKGAKKHAPGPYGVFLVCSFQSCRLRSEHIVLNNVLILYEL
jgi:hypothetical protein